jgi:hypothetical protein
VLVRTVLQASIKELYVRFALADDCHTTVRLAVEYNNGTGRTLAMRTMIAIVALSIVAGMPFVASATEHHGISRTSLNRIAPADEYFGRLKESILEIRNRLDDLDRRSDDDMLQPGTTHNLDDLQDAIRDWQRKYPHDPWLPGSMHRLLRDYQRAGTASSPASLEIIALMQSAYPDDEQTAQTVASLFGSSEPPAADDAAPPNAQPDDAAPPQPDAETVSVEGTVVDAQSGDPIIGAVIFVTTDGTPSDASSAPFVATGDDGSFSIDGLPASTLQVVVEPPRGSDYAPYRVTLDGSGGDVDAGVIRLSDGD